VTRIFDIKFPRPTIENLFGYTSRKKLAHDPFEFFLDPLPGDNFTNILLKGFTLADPKSAKKSDRLTVFFALLVSVRIKAAQKNVGEIDPRGGKWQLFMAGRPHWKQHILCYPVYVPI